MLTVPQHFYWKVFTEKCTKSCEKKNHSVDNSTDSFKKDVLDSRQNNSQTKINKQKLDFVCVSLQQ